MTFLYYSLVLVFLYSITAKTLYWTAIFQQKEYRIDRLIAFLKSAEGRLRLAQIIVFPFKKSQIKRPKLTLRALMLFAVSLTMIFVTPASNPVSMIVLYLLIPVFVFVANLPFWLMVQLITFVFLYIAGAKLKKAKPVVVGVSGSYGKTTTKILISQLLLADKSVWHTPKSFNTPLSLSKSIVNQYAHQEVVIIEYASYRQGEISLLAKIFPVDLAVFTGINLQHLAIFGSEKKMLSAETELFGSMTSNQKVFYNSQDRGVCQEILKFNNLALVSSDSVNLLEPKINERGYLSFEYKGIRIQTKLLGQHYLPNLALAVGVAQLFGVSPKQIKKQLTNFQPPAQFISRYQLSSGLTVIDDGNTTNPDGFDAALKLAKGVKARKKVLLASGIIDLADKTGQIHTKLAKQAQKVFDVVIFFGVDGSYEFATILRDNFLSNPSRLVVKQVLDALGKNDLLLVEGRMPVEVALLLAEEKDK